MTPESIAERIKTLNEGPYDPESLHAEEDKMLYEFVQLVADSGSIFAEHAKAILKFRDLEFPRWYA